jgi:UDP-N-acetyl-D-glucosamine dehydrogenase
MVDPIMSIKNTPDVNTDVPGLAVVKIQDALNGIQKAVNGSKVLILGVGYKPDVDDLRENPIWAIIHLLQQKGAIIIYHDPYAPQFKNYSWGIWSVSDLKSAVRSADVVVDVTHPGDYDYSATLNAAALIVDTSNLLG